MRYEIAHQLRLTYPQPVWEHHVEVRLTPQHNRHQHVLAAELAIDPACEPRRYHDCFGNPVHYCNVIAPHDHLAVRMRAQVDTFLTNPFDYPVVPPARESEWVAQSLRAQPRLWDYLLHRSPATPDLATLSVPDWSFPARNPAAPLLDSLMAALEWIGEAIEYAPGFSHVPAKLEDALAKRAGGCQELAHLLIGLMRAWGFPARYVMGYQDPGYDEDAEGERPHAWAEVLIPGAGWRGFDPTTRLVANETYIAAAVGRDATDTMPIKAVCKGGEVEATTDLVLEVTRDQ